MFVSMCIVCCVCISIYYVNIYAKKPMDFREPIDEFFEAGEEDLTDTSLSQ